MPILGDTTYGSTAQPAVTRGIALHARVLALHHPVTGRPMRLVAAVPSNWKDAGILLPEPLDAESIESIQERPAR